MKKTACFLTSTGVLLLLLLCGPTPVIAAEDRHSEAIDRALKASQLSKTEQADVHTKAEATISAGVPAEDVEIIVTRATGRGLDAGSITRLLDIGASAKREGLPAGPVLDRIEQGLSKAVPAERIQAASDRLVQKLQEAKPARGRADPGRCEGREAAQNGRQPSRLRPERSNKT